MASRDLKVVVSAKDEASSKLRKMNDSIQAGMKKTAIAAAAAGTAIALGASKAIKAYQVQEIAETQLNNSIINIAKGTKKEVEMLKEKASALQKVGVVGDEAIITAQAQLATFGVSTKAVGDLSEAMTDFAVSQYGANVSVEQMNATANTMGKLVNGIDVSRLKSIGIVTTEAQRAMLEYGTEAERVATVQEIMNANLKITNKQMRETSSGGIVALKNDFGDMMENIGEALIPALMELTKALAPIVLSAGEWTKNNAPLIASIVKISAVVLPLLIVLPMLVTAIGAVGTILAFVAANPVVLIIGAIVGLIAAIALLIKNWDAVKAKVIDVWRAISAEIGVRIAAIKLMIIAWIESVGAGLSAGWEAIKEGWSGFWEGMKGVAESAVNFITGIVEKIVGTIMAVIQKIEELKEKAKAGLSAAGGAIKGAGAKVAGVFRASGGNVYPGQAVTVGERGPEQVVFGQSGRVVPNNRMGGGGITVNVSLSNNTLLADAPEVAIRIGDVIMEQLRLQTRLS